MHTFPTNKRGLITYVAENLICLARADGVLLFGVAGPLVQVGAVDDVAQHVLAPLGHFIGDGVGRDVSLGFALVVVLLVQSLFVEKKWHIVGKNQHHCRVMRVIGCFVFCKQRRFFPYQSLVLLLLPTAHHLGEVHQGSGHVVALGLLMGLFVLGLVNFILRLVLSSSVLYFGNNVRNSDLKFKFGKKKNGETLTSLMISLPFLPLRSGMYSWLSWYPVAFESSQASL